MSIIEKWKRNRDYKHGSDAIRHMKKFWSDTRRKDMMVETMLAMNWSIEELEELSNLFGREAHSKGRKELE